MTAVSVTTSNETVVVDGGTSSGGATPFSNTGTNFSATTLDGLALEISTDVGDLSALVQSQTSLVGSVNQLNSVRNLSSWFSSSTIVASTSLDSNLVALVSDLKTEFGVMRQYISGLTTGDVSGLITTATNLVLGVNEVYTMVGALDTSTTSSIESILTMISGLPNGDVSGLLTTATNLVSAVNEVRGSFVTSVNSVSGPGAITIDTDSVSEGSTNKYFTNARAIASTLTSYSAVPGTVTALDTVISGLQKVDGNASAALIRSNHVGVQSSTTITDFAEAAQDAVGATFIDGSLFYDDATPSMALATGGVTNTHINAAAAIDLSKLGLLSGLVTTNASAAATTDSITAAIGKIEARMPVGVALASAFASTSVTRADVTGWSIPVVSGGVYSIRVLSTYQTAVTTTGCSLGMGVVGAAGTLNGVVKGAISAAAVATELASAVNATTSALTTTGVSAANTPHHLEMDFIFVCTASGTLTIQFATEVAGSSAQLNAGSCLIYSRLS